MKSLENKALSLVTLLRMASMHKVLGLVGNWQYSVIQISRLLLILISPTDETKSVKHLLGKTSKLVRIKNKLSNAPVNAISLKEL